jgi:hypothetical protein
MSLQKLTERFETEELRSAVFGIAVASFASSIASAALGLHRLRLQSVVAWNADVETAARWIAEKQSETAVFAFAGDDLDVVTVFAGKVSYGQTT